ncbi:IS3 family transposase [Paenibacillus sp. yr247]
MQRERKYGYRRITAELKRQYDVTVNHKKLQRIM